MGKKNKKEKKGKGKEKTDMKAEKKADKRAKKELVEKGEEDIEKLIAEFQEHDRNRNQTVEEKCSPPSQRSSMTLTPHPDKDELIMFGGEFFTGNKMYMYNDLLFYNIKKNEWLKVTTPNTPPPRSSHQAVALKQDGGQLWIFGGEFASPTQSQFYHYSDLWVYKIRDKNWEKIRVHGGPSARSGHRMAQVKKQLIVFGGFHDNTRNYRYFNDLYSFDLENYTWSRLDPVGFPPAPRSACVMAYYQDQNRLLVYGGYSKEKVKKDVDRGMTHTDMCALSLDARGNDESLPPKWRWNPVKQSGVRPSLRSGMSLALSSANTAVCFGGVFDQEEDEEQLKGNFYNEMFSLDLEKGKWHSVVLRGINRGEIVEKKKRRRKDRAEGGDNDEEAGEDEEEEETEEDGATDTAQENAEMEVGEEDIQKLSSGNPTEPSYSVDTGVSGDTGEEDSIFKVTIGPQTSSANQNAAVGGEADMDVDVFIPCPRMNALLAVKNGVVFLYGGMVEEGDKELTLSDFYSLDLHKLDSWKVIIENDVKTQVWEESDSSSDGEDEEMEGACGGGDDDDEDSDDMDMVFEDAPDRISEEDGATYFERTKEYWIDKAKAYSDMEKLELSGKHLEKLAKEMCLQSS